jgi:hypothetical protein
MKIKRKFRYPEIITPDRNNFPPDQSSLRVRWHREICTDISGEFSVSTLLYRKAVGLCSTCSGRGCKRHMQAAWERSGCLVFGRHGRTWWNRQNLGGCELKTGSRNSQGWSRKEETSGGVSLSHESSEGPSPFALGRSLPPVISGRKWEVSSHVRAAQMSLTSIDVASRPVTVQTMAHMWFPPSRCP